MIVGGWHMGLIPSKVLLDGMYKSIYTGSVPAYHGGTYLYMGGECLRSESSNVTSVRLPPPQAE